MTQLHELRHILQPHFVFADSISDCFHYYPGSELHSEAWALTAPYPLYTFFFDSPADNTMDNVLHLMQADALNQIVARELDHHNNTGNYVLAESWTTDCLFSPILDFPSTLAPCIRYITIQHSHACMSRIGDLKVGDMVCVKASLFRHDGYEHCNMIRVWAALARSVAVDTV
ncbi:hypothetical protein B0H17DRAFT_1127275 [Mycena rosella]|uniref:Uncharacterized protein n=1 Tax=Mycena rosella TaxID=1033263 RepID=A0AAD7M6F3_MYCRO|nr:hypothetical protein B0H17DRAFT_1127275 [Mycena rosella]